MREEDSPALDWKQVEEIRKKLQIEEDARRKALEAEEEEGDDDEDEEEEREGENDDDY